MKFNEFCSECGDRILGRRAGVVCCSRKCAAERLKRRRLERSPRPVQADPKPEPEPEPAAKRIRRLYEVRYAIQDLEALVGWPTADRMAEALGCCSRTVERYRQQGIPHREADELACAFGFHPVLVWPHWLDFVLTAEKPPPPVPLRQRPPRGRVVAY